MSHTPTSQEIQANLAEQLDWRFAERDDQTVAQALVNEQSIDAVYTLDEAGLLTGFFTFLQASGILTRRKSPPPPRAGCENGRRRRRQNPRPVRDLGGHQAGEGSIRVQG